MDIRNLGREPIPGDNPVGQDIRFEPEMEEIEAEIEKLTNPTAEGGVDWDKVLETGRTILAEKSKNFQVATYVSYALIETKGVDGIADAVHILRDMVETYWDTMYPPKKRARARRNSVDWWKDRVDSAVQGWEQVTWPGEQRDPLIEDLQAFDSFLGDNLDDAPILRSLINEISSVIAEEAEAKPEPEPEPAKEEAPPREEDAKPAETPKPKAAKSGSLPPTNVNTSDMSGDQILRQALNLASHASSTLVEENLQNPLGYRVNRIASWLTVDALPPAEGSTTLIPAPDEQIANALQHLYDGQNWRDLIEAAESRVGQFLFWLDLSRYSSEALNGLGFTKAADAVAEETLAYVTRLPGIENLSFAGDTPFADPDTRAWLSELQQQRGGGEGGGGDAAQQAADDTLKQTLDMLKDNKTAEALKRVKAGYDAAGSGRERLIWAVTMCRLLIKSGSPRLIMPYVDQVLALLDDNRVDQWEPELAVKALEVALMGLRKQIDKDADPETPAFQRLQDRIDTTLDRIASLDPARALGLM